MSLLHSTKTRPIWLFGATLLISLSSAGACSSNNSTGPTSTGNGGSSTTSSSTVVGTASTGTSGGSTTNSTAAVGTTATGTSGSGGSGGGGVGCAGLPLCEGFETGTVGAAPNAALWSIVTGCGMSDPASTVTIDDSQHNTGKNSVKVVGGTNTCGPLFSNTSAFASLGTAIYGRFFVRFSVPTQMSHSAFLGLGFGAGVPQQVNDNLEMTQQYGVYVWNLHDSTLPNMAPSASTPVDTWTCIEFHTDAPTGNLDTWIDGTSIAPMTFDPNVTAVQPGVNSTWAAYARPMPFQPTSISFGWVTFGGMPATVWFDDIALGKERVGCTP